MVASRPTSTPACCPQMTYQSLGKPITALLIEECRSLTDHLTTRLWAAGEMTGLFYNEYPPATSCLRSMTFGRLAGLEIAQNLGGKQGQANGPAIPLGSHVRSDSLMDMDRNVLAGEGKVGA